MTLPWKEVTKLFEDLNQKLVDAGYKPHNNVSTQDKNPGKKYARLWVKEKEDSAIRGE